MRETDLAIIEGASERRQVHTLHNIWEDTNVGMVENACCIRRQCNGKRLTICSCIFCHLITEW